MWLGTTEILLILLIILLLLGPKRLPQLARALGEAVGEFKKAMEETEKRGIKKKRLRG